MLDRQEIKWLEGSANELNNLLQNIHGYAQRSADHLKDDPVAQDYLNVIVRSVGKAAVVLSGLHDYVVACQKYLEPKPPEPPSDPYSSTSPELQDGELPSDRAHDSSVPLEPPLPSDLSIEESAPAATTPSSEPPFSPAPPSSAPTLQTTDAAETLTETPAPPSEIPPEYFAAAADVKKGNVDFSGVPIVNPDGNRELIMVVDDEVHVSRLIQMMLTEADYKVVVAPDGFSAIQIYRKIHTAVDLVLLDFSMPIMDGGDVFEELRLVNPRVAVLLSSGFPQEAKLSKMLAKGLRGFMPKPYTKEKLLTQIRSALDYGKKVG
ncbi:MAG: response regulator [Verrucomicrobiales bacterium]